MDIIKVIMVGLIAVAIIVILKQYRPEYAVFVSIIAGVIILLMATGKINTVISFVNTISNKTNINSQFIKILIKITGIAILTEFAVSICKDSGETAVANKVDVGGKIIIITLSMPIIQSLLETVIKILP